jgi:hypothetical protein
MSTKKSKLRTVGKGLLWAFLPMQAWQNLLESKRSIGRMWSMIRDRNAAPFAHPEEMTESELKRAEAQAEAVEQGKEIILKLSPRDRFELYYKELGWTPESLATQKKALARSHAIRLCMLIFTALISPALAVKQGWWILIYCAGGTAFLSTLCIKSACFFTQIEERALWAFKDLCARPNFWLLKRSFWFLESNGAAGIDIDGSK